MFVYKQKKKKKKKKKNTYPPRRSHASRPKNGARGGQHTAVDGTDRVDMHAPGWLVRVLRAIGGVAAVLWLTIAAALAVVLVPGGSAAIGALLVITAAGYIATLAIGTCSSFWARPPLVHVSVPRYV
jgi:hypothetical protein